MGRRVIFRDRDPRVFDHFRRVKHTKLKPRFNKVLERRVDLGFLDQPLFDGISERFVFAAARKIGAALYAESRSFLQCDIAIKCFHIYVSIFLNKPDAIECNPSKGPEIVRPRASGILQRFADL